MSWALKQKNQNFLEIQAGGGAAAQARIFHHQASKKSS
jgi:hypothetical protein